jgi:hypothetical protein
MSKNWSELTWKQDSLIEKHETRKDMYPLALRRTWYTLDGEEIDKFYALAIQHAIEPTPAMKSMPLQACAASPLTP